MKETDRKKSEGEVRAKRQRPIADERQYRQKSELSLCLERNNLIEGRETQKRRKKDARKTGRRNCLFKKEEQAS